MHDLVIRGGLIIDGTGKPGTVGDVAVDGGRLAAVGGTAAPGKREVDARGQAVSPGFIDIHSHSDTIVLVYPLAESKTRQGVTTEAIGNCGNSAFPLLGEARERASRMLKPMGVEASWTTLAEYRTEVERRGVAVNLAPFVGHGTVRVAAMGMDDRPPTAEELGRMQQLVRQAMDDGAFGITTGLIYPPGCYSNLDEVAAVTRPAAEAGGIYMSHLRNESDLLLDAVEEAIQVGRRAGLPVQISHHKAAGRGNWGKVRDTLAMIDRANAEGLDVTGDVYPYTAGSTSLATLVPAWAHAGGTAALVERLKNPEMRARFRYEMEEGLPGWENFAKQAGFDNVLITSAKTEKNSFLPGLTLAQAASRRGQDPYEALFDILVEEEASSGMVVFMMDEADVARVLAHPKMMVGSDASGVAPHGPMARAKPHPRAYGTFPRALGYFARGKELMPLETAVWKMTGFPAQRLGLTDRGRLVAGTAADIVVFDPATVADRATYADPHQFPEGIDVVVVNGQIVVEEGTNTGAKPGKVLRRSR